MSYKNSSVILNINTHLSKCLIRIAVLYSILQHTSLNVSAILMNGNGKFEPWTQYGESAFIKHTYDECVYHWDKLISK